MRSFLRLLRADLARLSVRGQNVTGLQLWRRFFHPRFAPVLLIRLSLLCHGTRVLRPFGMVFSLMNVVLFGIEVASHCRIGPGLMIPHSSGTVIGAAELGSNVTIFQGVTLGAKFADLEYSVATRPVVGNEVVIGAGAKVLGGIRIGDRAVIAANSLVTEPVPEGGFAIGVPAAIKVKV